MQTNIEAEEPKIAYSPSEIHQMIEVRANVALADIGKLGFIRVFGVLGPVRDSKYPIFYGIELRDVSGGDPILLDIPKNLCPENLTGKEVYAGGWIKPKKGLKFALSVSRIAPKASTSPEVLREEKSLREILSNSTLGPTEFPEYSDIKISCIHGKSSLVLDDFLNQVSDLEGVTIEDIAVNLLDPDSIADAIQHASGDVAVLMRGGGSEGDFEVFNRPQVLLEWRELESHKISALGHTTNTTILDRFSHRTCDTPTDAGRYIRQRINSRKAVQYWMQRSEQSDKNLSETVQRLNLDFDRRFQEAMRISQQDLDAARKQLEALRTAEESLRSRNQELEIEKARRPSRAPQWIWIALPAAVILGALVALFLK